MESISLDEALKYCLENPEGLSANELLGRFPQHREELEPLLTLDANLKSSLSSLPLSMRQESRAAMQQRIKSAAIARSARDGRSIDHAPERQVSSRRPWIRPRLVASLVSILLVALVWWLSATSLPDSIFYPVKLTTENTLLGLSGNPSDLVRGHINLANVRLLDIRSMQAIGKLAQAVPAFDNYDYHLRNCLDLWDEQADTPDPDVARLLYTSSLAGQRVFEGIGSATTGLPPTLQGNIQETMATVDNLNLSTSQVLQQAGIDLDQVLRDADARLTDLLTPGPAPSPAPAPTPVTASSPAAQPTLTAVLWAAQTAISEGGTADTPVIAAAETVIAGGTGTPIAQAIQTMLAQPTRISTPTIVPNITVTVIPTVTVTVQPPLTVTVTTTPVVEPALPLALPSLTAGAAATAVTADEEKVTEKAPIPTVAPTQQTLQPPR